MTERARQLLDDVIRKKRSDGDLAKIAYTLQAGREPMAERLAFTAESIEELKMKLMSFSNDHIEHAHIWRGRTAKHHSLAASLTSDEDMALTINAWLKKGKYGKACLTFGLKDLTSIGQLFISATRAASVSRLILLPKTDIGSQKLMCHLTKQAQRKVRKRPDFTRRPREYIDLYRPALYFCFFRA